MNVFFSVRVKLKSSNGQVSVLFRLSVSFSHHGQPEDCEYGSLEMFVYKSMYRPL